MIARLRSLLVERRAFATLGTALIIGIGYIDPGNWATDAAATRYGLSLLWVVAVSGVAAAVLQILTIRLAMSTGKGLAEMIVERWSRFAANVWPFYLTAIIATDVAEFVGLALGCRLALPGSAVLAVGIAAATVGLMLAISGTALKRFETVCTIATFVIGVSLLGLVSSTHPDLHAVALAAVTPSIAGGGALLALIGIVGATIMPHNLLMHGSLLLRKVPSGVTERRKTRRRMTFEIIGALALATVLNAAILLICRHFNAAEIEQLFARALQQSGRLASIAILGALIAAALASSASGVLAGDCISRPGMPIVIPALYRRAAAVLPAAAALLFGVSPDLLLEGSQLVLGLVLPAVSIPLLILYARERLLNDLSSKMLFTSSTAVVIAALVCDGYLTLDALPH